jgi:deoxycytidine triphosphate deaminase
MPLSRQTLKALEIIRNGRDECFTEVGYDLTVGEILEFSREGGDSANVRPRWVKPPYELKPRTMVVIFSKESVCVPKNVCGFAHPKTALCQDGVLAFNTGIIDPGFGNCLSATIINFSEGKVTLEASTRFLRVCFDHISTPTLDSEFRAALAPDELKLKAYRHDVQKKAADFPPQFLNIGSVIHKSASRVMQRQRDELIKRINVLVAIVTIFALVVPALQWFIGTVEWRDRGAARANEARSQEDLSRKLAEMETRQRSLEARLAELPGKP